MADLLSGVATSATAPFFRAAGRLAARPPPREWACCCNGIDRIARAGCKASGNEKPARFWRPRGAWRA